MTNSNEEIDLKDVNYEELFFLSKFHDLAHLIYYELQKRNALNDGEITRKFKSQFDTSLYRAVQRDVAIEKIRNTFERCGIPFILLKGAYLMNLYPESWMRSSSDVDVLVKLGDHSIAVEALKQSGFTAFTESKHDVSFYTQERFHVELHYLLIEKDWLPNTANLLEDIWNYTTSSDKNERIINDELLYLYHLAHMAKHFKIGGCGVRSFIDLWFLNHSIDYDASKRKSILSESDIQVFAQQCELLSEQWFSNKITNQKYDEFEEYIINGGIYGTTERKVIIEKKKAKNGLLIILNGFFCHIVA